MKASLSSEEDLKWMRRALLLARQAADRDEVPVGAILVRDGQMISKAFNLRESLHTALGHAELLTIQRASQKLKEWRLLNTTLYVTLEPCIMCTGALVQARISRLVYGATDPKGGAIESLYQISDDNRLNHKMQVEKGILAEECGLILKEFFRKKRARR